MDSLTLQTIEYPHIPTQRYFTPVNLSLLHIDFAKQGHRLGYIKGAGDKVPGAVKQLGYEVDFFGDKDLTAVNLQKYDEIHRKRRKLRGAIQYGQFPRPYEVEYVAISFIGIP